mmetsp:Transcript_400/g.575  ORF Transcript_400/g.575 Transcript_400/m.575 type:complete len:122 (-) Transcript_400:2134-2499(-)
MVLRRTPSSSALYHLREDQVFKITLSDPNKLKRKWPPSPQFLLLMSLPLLLYPVWVILFSSYRQERYRLLFTDESLSTIILDAIATWVLEQVPVVAAKLFTLHVAACLAYVGLWKMGVVKR